MSSAPPLSTPLALARVAHVAEALLACVDSTFGVAGKDRWIRNARNQVVITNSGDAVLRSVTVTHPVASYLREVITTHAERHGDGSVSTLAMVTAGVARVAELCGRDFGSGDARRKRASLARALSRVADGALRTTLLPLAIDAATVRVPLPGLERLEMSRDASEDDTNERETGENVSRWDVGDRFRAGLRAAAATSLAGASAPATRAALARLAVTLVANTVDRALRDKSSDRDRLEDELLDDGDDVEFADGDGRAATYKEKKAARKIETRKSKIESLRVALRDLRARPPVWSARGASVEASLLLRGVLLRGRLVRVAEVRRETRENTDKHVERKSEEKGSEKERSGNAGGRVFAGVDAPARVAALRGVALDDPFFGNEDDSQDGFECAYASGSERNTEENETADREEVLRSARLFAARTRADVLASRGVDLVVSSTRVSALVASALADRGVFVIELVSARDFDALLTALRIAPARSPTSQALKECDVGVANGGFREVSAGPGQDLVFTHVFTDASFAALVRGFGAETAEAHAELVRRTVRVLTRAFVLTETHASLCLVPGGGACEAALHAAARSYERTVTAGVDSDAAYGDRESALAALDVLRAMARAVPDALAGTGRANKLACSRRGAADVLAAAANAHEALFGDGDGGVSLREKSRLVDAFAFDSRALVGLVSAASAPETAHPGTAAAILDEPPPRSAFSSDSSALETCDASERTAYAHATADPVLFAVLEPAETKREALVAAVEAVAQTTRIEQIVRARGKTLFPRAPARAARRHRRNDESDESDESEAEDDSEAEAESSDAE
jgi:hypothetical protein